MPIIGCSSLIFVGMLSAGFMRPVLAEPPRVEHSLPEHGSVRVDPALPGLKVEFDQEMSNRAFSWVGRGPTFPPPSSQPYWIDDRTCILPVTLEPNHFYQFQINSEQYMGFRNTNGEPAVPHLVQFVTGGADDIKPLDALDEQTNRRSLQMLRTAIDERYSYRDRLGLDWEALFKTHEADLLGARMPIEFALQASLLLTKAEDMHISISAEGQTFQPHRWSGQRNFNFEVVNRRLNDLHKPNPIVTSGHIGPDLVYLRIDTWHGGRTTEIEQAIEAIDGFRDRPGLIIDVRGNGGGDEMLARQIAGCFITAPKVYAKHDFRDTNVPGGFTAMQDRIVHPNRDAPTYAGVVVVLIGPVVCSSNEAFVAMMKRVTNCTLIGMRTYGGSGNPKPVELPNGVTVMLPSWRSYLPDDTLLEGRGIEPDVLVETKPEDFASADPVFERALEFLRQKRRE